MAGSARDPWARSRAGDALLAAASFVSSAVLIDAQGRAERAMVREMMGRLLRDPEVAAAGPQLIDAARAWLNADDGVPRAWAEMDLRRAVHAGQKRLLAALVDGMAP